MSHIADVFSEAGSSAVVRLGYAFRIRVFPEPCRIFARGTMPALFVFFFFQAEDGIRDLTVTGVQTCALPISGPRAQARVAVGHESLERLEGLDRHAALHVRELGLEPAAVACRPERLGGDEIGRASCRERV